MTVVQKKISFVETLDQFLGCIVKFEIRGRIFSGVRPFCERAVSNLDL
jgi:hypothetical protein